MLDSTLGPVNEDFVSLANGGRLTARIDGARVAIGDAVDFVENRNGIPYFRKK